MPKQGAFPDQQAQAQLLARQQQLVRSLQAALVAAAGDEPVQLHETHVSWVLVAGGQAWKIKKAVRFDFLDFSTLDARRHFCDEELRLNRRFAPDLYLDVVPVTASASGPVLGGSGPVLEYALHMRAFAQEELWSARLAAGKLTANEIDGLAAMLARLHDAAAPAPADSRDAPWATPALLHAWADETLAVLAGQLGFFDRSFGRRAGALLATVRARDMANRSAHDALLRQRRQQGRVRDCHGDLHLGNILTRAGRVQAFDCIEFHPALRWIDVIDDLAFPCMDLGLHRRIDFAARLLNGYLERSGDYAGLAVLPYYLVQRALVRAKVALLRARQLPGPAASKARAQARACLVYALRWTRERRPALVLMHGLSGSGKSFFAARLIEAAGAVRLRSDVERKRMHGLPARTRGGVGLYGDAATQAVYARLLEMARQALQAGWPVVVDAAFLRQAQRQTFIALAQALGLPCVIVATAAPAPLLRQRIVARAAAGGDPSDADLQVLARQMRGMEALSGQERRAAVVVEFDAATGHTGEAAALALALQSMKPMPAQARRTR